MSSLYFLPVSQAQVKKGICPECASEHTPDLPHNAQSLFYNYKFYSEEGRWPTWKDAISHSSLEVQEHFERELRAMNAWTEPDSLVPDVLPTDDRSIGTVQHLHLDDSCEHD